MPSRARALGAWVVGVGLHPLALVAYELVHRGNSRAIRALFALAAGVLVAERLLSVAAIAVPWFLSMTAYALVTSWWVRQNYFRASEKMPAFHPLGLLAAIAAGLPILFLQHFNL